MVTNTPFPVGVASLLVPYPQRGGAKKLWGVELKTAATMGTGASVARSPTALAAELERLRQRELNTKVRR